MTIHGGNASRHHPDFVYIVGPVTERVGRYQLLDPIGVGPSGAVSRAKVFGVAGFERQFAVKRFHSELTTTAAMAQALSAAARAYGGLEHPRIARMSEFGVAQGTTFTAVEYVAGLDALRLIAEARLASATLAAGGALALVSQAARAVGYAHGRGLTHLGLSPTNVIVTAEGDVKITDFGILSATLPQRPIDVARLAQRIQYLAPEQLANEATSAATDVFALGVLAYELVTGQRTFRGDTPQQVAQSVMSGPPAEPPLPRPIVRVLQRCLARSPFERFPDARALADALDAALRVAPVPGTRKDIGSQVKAAVDRLAELHSGELSGMVALNVGTANMLRGPVAPVVALGNRDSQEGEFSTTEFVRPDTPVAGPAPLVGPARSAKPVDATDLLASARDKQEGNAGNTVPDLPKSPFLTVPGLAPPPIPVPPGLSPPPIPPPPPSGTKPSTLLGISNKPPPIPPIRPFGAVPPPKPGQGSTRPTEAPADRPSESPVSPLRMLDALASAPSVPTIAKPSTNPALPRLDGKKPLFGDLRPATDAPGEARTDLVIETEPGELPDDRPTASLEPEIEISGEAPSEDHTVPGIGIGDPIPPKRTRDYSTDELSPLLVETVEEDAEPPAAAVALPLPADPEPEHPEPAAEPPAPEPQPPDTRDATPEAAKVERQYPSTPPIPPAVPYVQSSERAETMDVRTSASRRSRLPWIIAGVVGVLAIGGGAYLAIMVLGGDDDSGPGVAVERKDAATAVDAIQVAVAGDAAAATSADAVASVSIGDAAVATTAGDAATPADAVVVVAAADAVVAPPAIDAGVVATASGELVISSTPVGARVFFDGADVGVTPLKLPGTADRHTIALLLAGHELYVAKVDGHGAFAIPLKEVTPTGGPAGIKVIKCKDKDRHYVFVDGKPTGQTCPTERIECELGPHVVDVYDIVSETHRKYEIDVKDTRLSYRVKIDQN